jgi:hypothetical protein
MPRHNLPCPTCNQAAISGKTRILRIRRRDKAIAVQVREFTCMHCPNPETGEPPKTFDDCPNESEIQEMWRSRYKESIPERGKPGRSSSGIPRNVPVQFMLTKDELESIDLRRGTLSRSAWIRSLIFADCHKN